MKKESYSSAGVNNCAVPTENLVNIKGVSVNKRQEIKQLSEQIAQETVIASKTSITKLRPVLAKIAALQCKLNLLISEVLSNE